MKDLSFRLLSLAALCLGTAPLWAARQPGAPLRPSSLNFFTRRQDVEIGKEAAQEVLHHHQIVRDKILQNYLQLIGGRLANTPEARESGFQFTFTILADRKVNAFALPGGPMFIDMGLLRAVDNEAQLAGAMAHEMSHVILRHGTAQLSKANLLEIPALLAEAASGSRLLGRLAEAGVTVGLNRFSRTDEEEADAMGAHLAAEAGWDPLELGRFFMKLERSDVPAFLGFLDDHPDPGNRQAAIAEEVRTLPERKHNYESGQFRRMKGEVGRTGR
jgi:predicted Zn-dependent protease